MPRKLPALTGENRAFWQGGKNDKLMIYYCSACSRYFHPPNPVCPDCNSFEVGPQPVSGKGQVISFTINYQPWTPELKVPFIIAIIGLIEQAGLRFVSNVVGIPVEDVHIGMSVKVHFQHEDDVWLPLFIED